MRFTLYTYFSEKLKALGAEGAAQFAKEHGFSSVEPLEMVFPGRGLVIPSKERAAEIKKELDKIGINMSCLSVAINIFAEDLGATSDKSAIDILKLCAENAAALGCPYLHHTLTIGLKELPFDAPMTLDGMFDQLCDKAEEVAKYANSLGVTVLYEPQGPFVNGVDNYGRFYNEMKRRGLKVGICGDIGNCLFVDESPHLFFEKFATDILHVHLKDYIMNQQDEFPNKAWSASKGKNMLAEVLIGDGIIDFDACMNALKEAGYNGSFALESVILPYEESRFARDMAYMEDNYPFF